MADADGRVLARGITFEQLRARLEHGLLDDAVLAANQNDRAWRPLGEVFAQSGARRMPALWYVTRHGKPVVGPVETETVQRGILAGRVPSDALVCRAGEMHWQPVSSVADFSSEVAEANFDGALTVALEEEGAAAAVWGSHSGRRW